MEPTTDGTRAPEDSFAKLFERIADAALVVEMDGGTVIEANAAARALLGYGREDLGTIRAVDIHPHEIPAFERFVEQVLAHGTWEQADLSCRTRGGAFVPARVRATDIEVFGRRCVLVVVHDLRVDRLASLGQAVRKISHDLRNTLSSAMILVENLSQRDDPAVQRSAERVMRSLERAVAMCRRTLSTGTAQEPAPEPRSVDLTALIDEVLAEMPRAAVAGANRVPAGFTVTVDDRQLYRALLNLARNAAAAEGTTRVAVEAARRHGAVTIDVVDDGPGLPLGPDGSAGIPDVVAHAGGSGLGLTIADELVRNNAGTLAVASTGTDGTRFRITLPDA
jgi:PAS domain S-box-containing protein